MSELEEALDWALNQIDGKTRYDNANQYHACRKRAEDCLQALRSTDPQCVVVNETEAIERVLADEGYDVLESATLAQKIAQVLRSEAEVKAEGAREERERCADKLVELAEKAGKAELEDAEDALASASFILRSQSSEGEE